MRNLAWMHKLASVEEDCLGNLDTKGLQTKKLVLIIKDTQEEAFEDHCCAKPCSKLLSSNSIKHEESLHRSEERALCRHLPFDARVSVMLPRRE